MKQDERRVGGSNYIPGKVSPVSKTGPSTS
jgi:hypothetical protein